MNTLTIKQKNIYPGLILKQLVVFPTEKISLVLEGADIARAVSKAHEEDHIVALIFQKNGQYSDVGVLAKVLEHWQLTPQVTGITVEGVRRIRLVRRFSQKDMQLTEVDELPSVSPKDEEEARELEALSRGALQELKKILQIEGRVSFAPFDNLEQEYLSPDQTSDVMASLMRLDHAEKMTLLETVEVRKRLEILTKKLTAELSVVQAEQRIQNQIEKEVSEVQKEFILKERLKAIEKELGIYEEQKEYDDLERKLLQAAMPKGSETKALAELHRLRQMLPQSAEVPYIRTYLEWLANLPWSKKSQTEVDLQKAQKVLDEDHYGLEKAKMRVLEYLAVQKLTSGKGGGSILCFVGPPGTGKTSVGQSIARALGRDFVRISLGGIRDEAEIRGHRRTYVGSMPGRIIQGMKNAGSKNPVFMLDEIDKIGADYRGDPAAALLEVLDQAQNNSFSDHYIEIPFDLSEVFFITTANILDPIPPALKDRMEVIEFPGYTDDEKFHIAKKFLIPQVLSSHGLNNQQLVINDSAVKKIINCYTKEAGVRELERKLAEIARKIAFEQASTKQGLISQEPVTVATDNLKIYLGPEEFELTMREEKDEVGVATGLAWTPSGGEIIQVEVTLVTGKGNLILTGQLGEVMQESAKAALSYVRSKAKKLGFADNFYYSSDIHIHVPSGGIPKDGPSSGIAIATALTSRLTNKQVKKEVALTGEITLSGKVLKVGGIKEKVLAAHRSGVETVILPADNQKNLVDIPSEIRQELQFKPVKHMDEVLKVALK